MTLGVLCLQLAVALAWYELEEILNKREEG
jgi:hypothetical protein